MKKPVKKQIKRCIAWTAAVAAVAGLAVMPLLAAPPREEGPQASILTARAETREISAVLMGGGLLESRDTEDLTIPAEVKLTRYLVGNGDVVEAGDPIAEVDRVSVMTAIVQVQDSLDSISADMEVQRLKIGTAAVTAEVSGTVKKVYARKGDAVTDVMLEHGTLAVISMDGLMSVTVECDTALKAGDTVLVTPEGQAPVEGNVVSNLEGSLKVTVKDGGYALDTPAGLTLESGEFLGDGILTPNLAWRAYGYSGTVSTQLVQEGQKVYAGQTLLQLTDTGPTAEYRALVSRRLEYEALLKELFEMYQSGTVNAPCSGIVSGADPEGDFVLEEKTQSQGRFSSSSAARRSVLHLSAPSGEETVETAITSSGLNGGTVGQPYVSALLAQPAGGQWSSDLAVPGLWLDPATGIIYGTPEAAFLGSVTVVYTCGDGASATKTFSLEIAPKPARYTALGAKVTLVAEGYLEVLQGTIPSPVSDPEAGPQGLPSEAELTAPGSYSFPVTSRQFSVGDLVWLIFDENGVLQNVIKSHSQASGTGGGSPGSAGGFGGGGMGGFGGKGGIGGGAVEEDTLYSLDALTVAVITSQEKMVLPITVDERDVVKLREGQTAEVTVDAMGGSRFDAVITDIALTGENQGGNSKFTVTVSVPRQQDMYPGMTGSVRIQLSEPEEVLAVPVAALVEEGTRVYVYTGYDEEAEAFLDPVEVTTGISDGEYVQVSGLSQGHRVYYAYYDTLEQSYEPDSGNPFRP